MDQQSLLNRLSITVSKLNYQQAGESRIKEFNLIVSAERKVALLGLNGAGKSTLIRLLLGELSATSGLIEYTEEQSLIQSHDLLFKQHLGYQADTMLAIAELSGLAYLKLCGSFKNIDHEQLELQIQQLAQQWQIEDILDKSMTSMSKGNLQKFSIAQAFLGDPKWLFFDEPCQSLDPVEQVRFNQNIALLENFESCVVSTHNVDHALEIADEIILIHQGVLVHHFSLDEPNKVLMVIKQIPTEEAQEFEQSLSQISLEVENRSTRILSLQLKEEEAWLALQGFAAEWSKFIEFCLPEKDALMPLFRLLASGELELTEKTREQNLGGEN